MNGTYIGIEPDEDGVGLNLGMEDGRMLSISLSWSGALNLALDLLKALFLHTK